MLSRLLSLLLLTQCAVVLADEPVTTSARDSHGGQVHEAHYAKGEVPGALEIPVDYYLWLPEGVETLRGVIVHQHGCGAGASRGGRTAADDLHWQALARKWDCALLGSSYEPSDDIVCSTWCDPRKGSGDRFLEALDHFADATGHPEISSAPWCLWGHSGGGYWASLMHARAPERIVAVWLQSGTAYKNWMDGEIAPPRLAEDYHTVPVLGCSGIQERDHERFHTAWDGLKAMQAAYRSEGGFFEFAADPRTGHECGDSRYLAIPFFDFWLAHRLPEPGAPANPLKPAAAAIADWEQEMAPKLVEFNETGAVSDDTPPPAPTAVTLRHDADGAILTWEAEADLESGIGGFIIECDGKEVARIPEKPVGRFGRPLFQPMSYHDTPEVPLPKMEWRVPTQKTGPFAVRTFNALNVESNASILALP